MLVEAVTNPMCYRWPDGEIQLVPGHPVDLPESRALRLLLKAPGKVRLVSQQRLPSWRQGCLITWHGADGRQRGPAMVDFLHTDPDGTCWAFVTLSNGWAAVNTKYVTKTEGGQTR